MLDEAYFMEKLKFETWNWWKIWFFAIFPNFIKWVLAKLNEIKSESVPTKWEPKFSTK